MSTVYLNWKGPCGTETVDEFTEGVDAPGGYREFNKYVSKMVREYNMAGMSVYRSRRACKAWTATT